MSRLHEEQQETLALIDAITTMTEKMGNISLDNMTFNAAISSTNNPFDFLLGLITKKVKYEEIVEWLVNFITTMLPAIELGVKGVLLSNIKETIDCTNDPRIPYWMRKSAKYSSINNFTEDRGILFNVRSLDFRNILSVSPLSKEGQGLYFGNRYYWTVEDNDGEIHKFSTEREADEFARELGEEFDTLFTFKPIKECEVNSPYEFARAKDFDAFLWFVIHKAIFPTAIEIPTPASSWVSNEYTINDDVTNEPIETKTITPFGEEGDKTLLSALNGDVMLTVLNDVKPLIVGNILTDDTGMISLCIKATESIQNDAPKNSNPLQDISDDYNDDLLWDFELPEIVVTAPPRRNYSMTVVPVSDDRYSANWYVNSGTYYDFLKKPEKRKPRDYTKEHAICNLKYLDNISNSAKKRHNRHKIQFTILPAPFVHIPQKEHLKDSNGKIEGEPIWRYIRMLFNAEGEVDSKGKYTVSVVNDKPQAIWKDANHVWYYEYQLYNGNGQISSTVLRIIADSGEHALVGENKQEVLKECYPGITVYEFNYDFVMGMQLFDPVVFTNQLIEMISFSNYSMHNIGLNVSVNKSETAYQMRVSEIVKNIIESTDSEVSDCFYTFSNSKFEAMLNDAELKRSQLYPFQDGQNKVSNVSMEEINSILSEFDDNATLQENKDVLTRAINTATASITQEVLPTDRYNVRLGIVTDFIKGIVNIIVESLLTPKIVMLLEVNKKLMGDEAETLSIDAFLRSIEGLLTNIVREIRDLILQAILDWALEILEDLVVKTTVALVKEQAKYYSDLMRALLKACSFKLKHRKALDSQLDEVDYADIDPTDELKTDNC